MILPQVNKFLFERLAGAATSLLRSRGTSMVTARHDAKVLFPLKSKSLLQLSGTHAAEFLQGLITNDMRHFDDGARSIYAMFLNNKGRVLMDTLIHKWHGDQTYLLECDTTVLETLQNHLKVFKLRRDINIKDVSKTYKLWGLISPVMCGADLKFNLATEVNIYKDPRLTELGYRVLTTDSMAVNKLADMIAEDVVIGDEDVYKYLRYKLGVCEGSDDLPPGKCFPLEVNCDFLHGVSFHKGCYIGQELTARIHHTGVVRKRMMPIKFLNDELPQNIATDSVVSSSKKPNCALGKIKGVLQDYGLALLKHKEAIEENNIVVNNYSAVVAKPTWWPMEAPKEKIGSSKES